MFCLQNLFQIFLQVRHEFLNLNHLYLQIPAFTFRNSPNSISYIIRSVCFTCGFTVGNEIIFVKIYLMNRISSTSFNFEGQEFFCIIRYRKFDNMERYIVRIMNHRLDSLLADQQMNVLVKVDGKFIAAPKSISVQQMLLRSAIIERIESGNIQQTSGRINLIRDMSLITPN